jgi:hypothetical protein
MADPMVDTATQRPPTGLDEGARELMLRVVREATGYGPPQVATHFFRDRFGGLDDYYAAVGGVWGEAMAHGLQQAVAQAQANAEFPGVFGGGVDPDVAITQALLLKMPEPDFRSAIAVTLRHEPHGQAAGERISAIARNRGAPWRFVHPGGFEYVGDEEVERALIRPALAAINRAEFAGGVKDDFETARTELATGTPAALRQAVHAAGCAVESAMKVVLDRHRVAYEAKRDAAAVLFAHLEGAGLVPSYMRDLVLVAMTPRNRIAGHGPGAVAHAVAAREAEAVLAGAAGAIAYLAECLP